MRNINSTFIEEKNKPENSPLRLYEIINYDGADNDLLLTENDEDVEFNGDTYSRFPIICEKISENTSGEIDSVRLVLANVSQLIQSYLKAYDFKGKEVRIHTVWQNQLDDADAVITDIYYIDSYSADIKSVSLTLTSKFDLMEVELPFRKYGRNYCSWKFKSTECGYSGEETSCNRTLSRCRELENVLRFGGYPSVPTKRLFI